MVEQPYLWLKALHIIAVISWLAGMLYLPRLYVYHSQVEKGSQASELFKTMELRLLRYIINPAMILSFVFGLWLASYIDWRHEAWLHAKFTLVILLTAYHGMLARWRKQFARDENRHSTKFYKIANEMPTILMIGIVILVVVKPF